MSEKLRTELADLIEGWIGYGGPDYLQSLRRKKAVERADDALDTFCRWLESDAALTAAENAAQDDADGYRVLAALAEAAKGER